jgi:MtN3 and saliva related transmembrane protein
VIDLLGWIGAFCLAMCGLPQLIKLLRTKRARDLSLFFLAMWAAGEICFLTYIAFRTPTAPLIANATWSLVLSIAILCLAIAWKDTR